MGFTHLQIRSGYSLMNSSLTIDKLVTEAKHLGFTSLALTDEQVMYGAISFYHACKKAGINPIIGMVIDVVDEDNSHENCILLAKNENGYKNLLKLSSHIQLQQINVVNKREIMIYFEDVIVILPFHKSPIRQLLIEKEDSVAFERLKKWKDCVSQGDFYLGIEPPTSQIDTDLIKSIKTLQTKWQVPVTAISDVRYLHASDTQAYQCLQAMKQGNKWSYETTDSAYQGLHLKTENEMTKAFEQVWSDLVVESDHIAKKCTIDLNSDQRMLPSFPVPTEDTAEDYLKKLCFTSLQRKYPNNYSTVEKRLRYELDVIRSMQFSDYFLIVWDFIQYAKNQGIMVGPGRGSAAGSLVAYLLDITDVDPIHYDLLFERFLNPERVSMPDIDIDFSDHRRDEVIEYVRDKYGAEHVAQIITFGTFATRSLLRELIKTMDIEKQDAAFILKEIPANNSKNIVESVKASKALTDYIKQSKTLQVLFRVASKLEGLPRHISTHAAGVVISKQSLVEHVPLIASQNDMYLTQYAMKELESIGLLKMDFLGLRNLNLMEKIISSVKYKTGKQIDLRQIPLDDEKTFDLLKEGKTNGVFQLESQGMQRVLTNLRPTHFEDVVAVNALYRPGPMEFIPTYIKRKTKEEAVFYPHQDLQPILEKTFGVLVYQEQIMQIANKMAGFSLGQADILRRAVSKKQKTVMERQKQKFIQGCLSNGYNVSVAREIYDWIVRFSDYGFNRSHAVAYSMISYQLAYLKTHFTPFFLSEVLSSVAGQQDKIRIYLRELKEFNINLLPPSINKSFGKYTVDNGQVRMGLLSIKGIGHQAVKEIVRVRKEKHFKNLFDFCLRIPLKIVNRQTIESLILAGAFDESYSNRASMLATLDQAIDQGELFKEFEDQPTLFQTDIQLDEVYIETEPFSQMKQLSFEKDLIGVYMSSHPLMQYRKKLRENGYIGLDELERFTGKKNMKTSAVIQEIKSIRTKRGDPMAFLVLGDESGEMDAVVFPELYRNSHRWIKEEVIVLITGKVEQRNGRIQLIIENLSPLDEDKLVETSRKKLFLKVDEEQEVSTLQKIKELANQYPGTSPILIYHQQRRVTYQLSVNYNLELTRPCLNVLYQMFDKDRIAIKNE